MAFRLEEVVPLGRSFEEYRRMFALSDRDLTQRILGCADGPASFNSGLTKRGGEIVSVDPLYRFSREEIRNRIDQVFGTVLDETRKNAHEFVWGAIPSVGVLGETRRKAMDEFLEDYPEGRDKKRYIDASLPELPFREKEFELALCSHYLFLYSPHLSLDFHLWSIRELCRVAREVRIFPLLELGAVSSRHLDEIQKKLWEREYTVSIVSVDYEFQRGGNRMMKVRNDVAV
ncbi:MAG: SAM-dependent methyltransferase [Nitrospirota bacterium]|nr:SAM-dependent methyltransferase [Nitrospirota bacterium]